MVAFEIAARPEDLAGFGVETSQAGRAEGNINATSFDDGRGRSVGIELVRELGGGNVEELEIVNDFSGVAVHADDGQFAALFGGGRDPHLRPPDDGTRPRAAMDGCFPFDAGRRGLLAPVK